MVKDSPKNASQFGLAPIRSGFLDQQMEQTVVSSRESSTQAGLVRFTWMQVRDLPWPVRANFLGSPCSSQSGFGVCLARSLHVEIKIRQDSPLLQRLHLLHDRPRDCSGDSKEFDRRNAVVIHHHLKENGRFPIHVLTEGWRDTKNARTLATHRLSDFRSELGLLRERSRDIHVLIFSRLDVERWSEIPQSSKPTSDVKQLVNE